MMAAFHKSPTNLVLLFATFLAFPIVYGEFILTHSPKSLSFDENASKIKVSDIAKTISLMMGYSPRLDITWTGLKDSNPFKRPAASVMFSVESSKKLMLKHVASFPTEVDVPFFSVERLTNHIQNMFPSNTPLIVDLTDDRLIYDVKNQYPSTFKNMPATIDELMKILALPRSIINRYHVSHLNLSNTADQRLLVELQSIEEIINSVRENRELVTDGTPDVYNFEIKSLAKLEELYGRDSVQANEGRRLVETFLNTVTDTFQSLYKDNVVVVVVTLPAPASTLVRKSRSLMAEADPTKEPPAGSKWNLVGDYDENYPVFFNIILWTMVILALSVYAIATAMWHLDPGRDSIIYRMTSNRMKKE